MSKIENAKDMITAAKTMADAGQGVAYTINSIGIMYNPNVVDFEIKSFDDLWDSRLAGIGEYPGDHHHLRTGYGLHGQRPRGRGYQERQRRGCICRSGGAQAQSG